VKLEVSWAKDSEREVREKQNGREVWEDVDNQKKEGME